MTALILIVEDEPKLTDVLREYLQRDGFDTELCPDGGAALAWLGANSPDLILLDLMLPGVDGLTVCREVRKTANTPIIMTTARVEEIDRLLGLELGADDYICKPFSPREVVARVKAVLRRTRLANGGEPLPGPELRLQEQGNKIYFGERTCELTAIEMRLLRMLMRHPGRIYSRDQLMDTVYPDRRLVSDRTIDSHIKNLRRKLGQLAGDREFVRSVYGAGYKFE